MGLTIAFSQLTDPPSLVASWVSLGIRLGLCLHQFAFRPLQRPGEALKANSRLDSPRRFSVVASLWGALIARAVSRNTSSAIALGPRGLQPIKRNAAEMPTCVVEGVCQCSGKKFLRHRYESVRIKVWSDHGPADGFLNIEQADSICRPGEPIAALDPADAGDTASPQQLTKKVKYESLWNSGTFANISI